MISILIFFLSFASADNQQPNLMEMSQLLRSGAASAPSQSASPGSTNEAKKVMQQIAERQEQANSYLPNYAQAEAKKIQKQMHENQIATDTFASLIRAANVDANEYSKYVESQKWNSFNYYSFSKNQTSEVLSQYFAAGEKRNYDKAARLGEQILYSNLGVEKLQGFTDDGIFIPEKLDPKIEESPLAEDQLQVPKNTQMGQVERRLANGYQVYWADSSRRLMSGEHSNELLQYIVGLAYLRLADSVYGSFPQQALGYLRIAKQTLNFLEGFRDGLTENIQDTIKYIPYMADKISKYYTAYYENDPRKFLDVTWKLIAATPIFSHNLVNTLGKNIEVIFKGSPYERGRVAGLIAFRGLINYATKGNFEKTSVFISNADKVLKPMFENNLNYEGDIKNNVFEPLIQEAQKHN